MKLLALATVFAITAGLGTLRYERPVPVPGPGPFQAALPAQPPPPDVPQSERHIQPIPASLVSAMAGKGMGAGDPILIRIYKSESELEVWKRGRSGRFALLRTWPICRWSGSLGRKTREGDGQAPEGFYTLTRQSLNPNSRFYLSFNLGYPNALERSLGYTGSALMVHGNCLSVGCFAMTDGDIAEIYPLLREAFEAGQASIQVQAFPFRMTPQNLLAHQADASIGFWRNLKQGSDHFEATGREPQLAACGGRYVFDASTTPSPDPAGPCPSLRISSAVASALAAFQAREQASLAAAKGAPEARYDWLLRLVDWR